MKKKKTSDYKKKVVKHLRDDIKTFKEEAREDRELIGKLKKGSKSVAKKKSDYKRGGRKMKEEVREGKKENKIERVMHEWKEGELRSGSKKGPKVKSRKQAIAIALSEARRKKKKK